MERLSPSTWQERRRAHLVAAHTRTKDVSARRARHEKHPIVDFLWVYFPFSVKAFSRWHPGHNVALVDAPPHLCGDGYQVRDGALQLDLAAFYAKVGHRIERIEQVLTATANATPRFSCFGLHEWAMVYKTCGERRHEQLPLRLPSDVIDDVVESADLHCTHFDAFRFFTPDAQPRNALPLTRANQADHEQPACLHAGMDLYRYAATAAPLVGSDLVVRTYDHALAARTLDMQASPYDVTHYGLAPVAIETAEGRAQYVHKQRDLAQAATGLRTELLDALHAARQHASR